MATRSSRHSRLKKAAVHPVTLALAMMAVATLLIGPDRASTGQFHEFMRPYDSWLQLLTFLGDGRVLLPACLTLTAALVIARHPARWSPFGAAACVISSGLVTNLLKMIIGRPRPYTDTDARYLSMSTDVFHWFTMNHDFESFPSGHSTAIFSMGWYLSIRLKDPRARIAAIAVAVLVSLTRVALYKHYFADTLAGAAVGIGITELVASLFGLAGRTPLLKIGRGKRAPIILLAATVSALAGSGCSSVKSRIGEHEGEFASFSPQTQAQIQTGHIDKGFTEEMVYMALGEPAQRETERKKDGSSLVVWKYAKPTSLLDQGSASGSLAAPYGYPTPGSPAQSAPMFYERSYYKVKFERGTVTDWDEGLQEKSPPPVGNRP